jgi:hypothetical protein
MNVQWRGRIVWLAAFLGFPIGGALATLLIGQLDNPLEGLAGGAAAGLGIGAAQMPALRTRWPVGWEYVLATAGGLAVGVALSTALFGAAATRDATLLRAPLTGLLLGGAQWLVLRRHIGRAYGWIPLTAVAYLVAWFITAQVIGRSLELGFVVFGASGALAFQFLTGFGLRWAGEPAHSSR